jgi:twitching motility protein PilT
MERFRNILKETLSLKSTCLSLKEGSDAVADTPYGQKVLIQKVDKEFLTVLFDFLFSTSKETLEQGQPTRGILNISSQGNLNVLGWKNRLGWRLQIYFPDSVAKFESAWDAWQKEYETLKKFEDASPVAVQIDFKPAFSLSPEQEISELHGGNFSVSPPESTTTSKPGGLTSFLNPSADSQRAGEAFKPQFSDGSQSASNQVERVALQVEPQPVKPTIEPIEAKIPKPPIEPSRVDPTPIHNIAPHSDSLQTEGKKIIFDAHDPEKVVVRRGDFPIDSLLRTMMAKKASDLHLTLTQPPVLRVDGEVHRESAPPLDAATMESYLLPIMPPKNREEFSTINDTDFAYELPGVGRFRVNMFRDNYGVGAVLRQIPAKILTATQLNLPKAITDFCSLQKGLVLVTGPTGSGKSTTLAAMIDKINKERSDHILTIEDPIEFVHPQQNCLVNQREVGKHTGSFKRALKAALREDPDIILIGELRDLETIAIAIETAETGHLVFGTLHTNTAVSTVDRIIDQFPSNQQAQIRTMLGSSLKGVIAQTLIKKIGGGRVAAHEILVVDDAVSSNIREGKNHMIQNTMMTQKAAGNQILNECLLSLVKDGSIEPMDGYLKSMDKKGFVEMGKRAGIAMAFADKDGKLIIAS